MVWFVVDDVLPFHERVIRAGNAAMGLWVRAGAWCTGQLTDGFIPVEVARTMGSAAEVRSLVTVGLWEPAEEDGQKGYRFHRWAEDGTGQKRQATRAEVEEKRRRERERKAAQRASRRDSTPPTPPVPPGVPVGHPADVPEESRGAVPIPVPVHTHMTYDTQSSYVPERESYPQDDDDRTRRAGYWRGWNVSNPERLVARIRQTIDRPVTEDQAILIVVGLLAKASGKSPVRDVQRYVEGCLARSWAEIQRDLDAATVAA